jgi:hypothetical protein
MSGYTGQILKEESEKVILSIEEIRQKRLEALKN